MGRARGANATTALAFETGWGITPASGFRRIAFASSSLGEEETLQPSNLLGYGREPQRADRGPLDDAGDKVVPLDARLIGLWLKMMFGAPTSTTGLAASGRITFSAQPTNNATITVAGQAFTFVSGVPAANQIGIGANLKATIGNAVRVLNASAVAGVAAATYRADYRGNAILIEHDTLGTSGNSFALVAGSSPASNATVSGATLTGGAASGARQHVFTSGALELPSASIEIGNPEVPSYRMNTGVKANTFNVSIQRQGLLNATVGLIAEGELPTSSTSQAGTVEELAIQRFSQFSGVVLADGVPIGDVVSGQLTFSNGLDPVPGLRGDGRITGLDEGDPTYNCTVAARYSSDELRLKAEAAQAVEMEWRWTIPNTPFRLQIVMHQVDLPKAKTPITGGGGVQADYACIASEHPGLQRSVTVTLINDVNSY